MNALADKINEGIRKYCTDQGISNTMVMFEDAVLHLTRLKRVLEMRRGNMVLIGLGGSGKQSLVSLAAFLS